MFREVLGCIAQPLYIIIAQKNSPPNCHNPKMHQHHNTSFQFKQKQNTDMDNIEHGKKQPIIISSTNNQHNNRIILCANPNYGIHLDEHLNKLLKFYEDKILKESIVKAVIGTFQKKNIIGSGEFQLERALEDASNQSKAYVDKIEVWLNDSIADSPAIKMFSSFKSQKQSQRQQKISSIMKLTQKIAHKLQQKKLAQIRRQFDQQVYQKLIKMPQNKEYSKAIYKMKFIKERVIENKRKWDNSCVNDIQ